MLINTKKKTIIIGTIHPVSKQMALFQNKVSQLLMKQHNYFYDFEEII